MKKNVALLLSIFAWAGFLHASTALAAPPTNDLSLQVVPSPFSVNLKPDSETTLELQVRNTSASTEKLKIEAKPFRVNENGDINIDYTKKLDIASWINFKTPQFTLGPGQWSNQEFTFKIPKESKYNYPFALVFSRQQGSSQKSDDSTYKDAVSVPLYINVDRSGQVRKIEVQSFSHSTDRYQNLSANFTVKLKNTGNMAVKPTGQIVISKVSDDKKTIATLPINASNEYIVPATSKTFSISWNDVSKSDKRTIGMYKAKLFAVYNDGLKDIQIEREFTFLVFPWRTLIVTVLVLLIAGVLLVIWLILRKNGKLPKHRKKGAHNSQK